MAAMRAVGNGHQLPAHANVREDSGEYLIELDVSDFTESELTIEAARAPADGARRSGGDRRRRR